MQRVPHPHRAAADAPDHAPPRLVDGATEGVQRGRQVDLEEEPPQRRGRRVERLQLVEADGEAGPAAVAVPLASGTGRSPRPRRPARRPRTATATPRPARSPGRAASPGPSRAAAPASRAGPAPTARTPPRRRRVRRQARRTADVRHRCRAGRTDVPGSCRSRRCTGGSRRRSRTGRRSPAPTRSVRPAVRPMSGCRPTAAASSTSSPRRRWVAATLTIVMPAAGTEVPPGTVTRNENAPAVPTHWSPSQIPRKRSYSVSAFITSRSSDDSGTPPNARTRLSYHVSHSGCRNTRKSVVIRHAYQGNAVRAREFPHLRRRRSL